MSLTLSLRNKIIWIAVIFLAATCWGYLKWTSYRTESFRNECRLAADDGDWEQLEDAATRWLSWDGTSTDGWLFLAEAASEQQDFERAAACLGRLEDDDPKCILALHERVNLLFEKLNQPIEAVKTCERILRIDARATMPYQRLLTFYAMTLQREEMRRVIRLSIGRERDQPASYAYLFTSNVLKFSNGAFVNSKWLEQHPDHEPFLVAFALQRGASKTAALFTDDEATAGDVTLLDEYLTRFPENIEVLAFHIDRQVKDGNVERVAELLSQAPSASTRDSRFLRAQGWYYAARDEFKKAITAFREALKQNAYDWRARLQLAEVLRRIGEIDDVKSQVALAATGRQLEVELLKLPKVNELSTELLKRMSEYAEGCGDKAVASGLLRRIVEEPDPDSLRKAIAK